MTKKGPRGLRPEEEALWRNVARQTTPLHRKAPPPPPSPQPSPRDATSPPPPPVARPAIQPFEIGARAETRLPVPAKGPDPIRMDARTFGRMSKGRVTPDARIDLHGMTAERARGALTAFLAAAHARGDRLVLVITGKGRGRDAPGPMPPRDGVLRRELPHWVQAPPLSSLVLQTAPAHRTHGGSGAYYVYLRRAR